MSAEYTITEFNAAFQSDKTRKLTAKEQKSVIGALFAGDTLAEVARRHGITKIRANLLFARAGGLVRVA